MKHSITVTFSQDGESEEWIIKVNIPNSLVGNGARESVRILANSVQGHLTALFKAARGFKLQ